MSERPVIVSSETVFSGKVFEVRVDHVRRDGGEYRQDVVVHRASFAIIAEPAPGRLILVRQYRHPAARELWEIPAARRELREETGFEAGSLERLWSVYPTPGFCDELLHIFYARELRPGSQSLDEDEAIEVRDFSLKEAFELQASGQIADMKTLLTLVWLQSRGHQ
jgi:ADP-ribose pyrophosphatase